MQDDGIRHLSCLQDWGFEQFGNRRKTENINNAMNNPCNA
jgi:hypothetical protein